MVAPISVTDFIVTNDCIDLLRSRRAASGYRNVYETHPEARHDGRRAVKYVAKVRVGGHLMRIPGSICPNPRECAARVIRWYMDRFGDQWRRAIVRRMAAPGPLAEAAWNKEDRGWNLWVYEAGKKVNVRERRCKHGWRPLTPVESRSRVNGKPVGRPKLFATKGDAERFVAVWLARRWGMFWEEVHWRIADARKTA